jgi:hypothetical protein
MLGDEERTRGFEGAIARRLAQAPPRTLAVLDLGTGPFAVLALAAARAGARIVYAVESDPGAAKAARAALAAATDVAPGVVVIVEGRSTAITLPEKVDVVLAEIVGSIAGEEGLLDSITDAQSRHALRPHQSASWIPAGAETLCSPASFALHAYASRGWVNGGVPPVRLNCQDTSLQLLAEPQVLESYDFADANLPRGPRRWGLGAAEGLRFPISAERLADGARAYCAGLEAAGSQLADAAALAAAVAGSLSGLAMWPRLRLDAQTTVNSRGARGEPRKSHWQTVLALMSPLPLPVVEGQSLRLFAGVDLSRSGGAAPYYLIEAALEEQDGSLSQYR